MQSIVVEAHKTATIQIKVTRYGHGYHLTLQTCSVHTRMYAFTLRASETSHTHDPRVALTPMVSDIHRPFCTDGD